MDGLASPGSECRIGEATLESVGNLGFAHHAQYNFLGFLLIGVEGPGYPGAQDDEDEGCPEEELKYLPQHGGVL